MMTAFMLGRREKLVHPFDSLTLKRAERFTEVAQHDSHIAKSRTGGS